MDPNLTSHLSELMRCPTFETDGTLVMRPYVTEEARGVSGGSETWAGVWGGVRDLGCGTLHLVFYIFHKHLISYTLRGKKTNLKY